MIKNNTYKDREYWNNFAGNAFRLLAKKIENEKIQKKHKIKKK